MSLQILDSRGAQLAQAAHVVSVVGVELVDPQKAIDLVAVGEIQPMPVDHRATAQEVPDRGQVTEGEVLVPDGPHEPRQVRSPLRRPPAEIERSRLEISSGRAAGSGRAARRRRAARRAAKANRGPEERHGEGSHDQASNDLNHTSTYI